MTERLNDLILVDSWDNPIGTAGKGEAHARPMLHRAFSVFLSDEEGRLLLQKRALGKYHSGGLWANSCCSHPRAEEETISSAELRLMEELGVTCPLREIGSFIYFHRFRDTLYEYEYDHVRLGRCSGPFAPDPEEIAELRWVTPIQLADELRSAPEQFAPWFLTAAPMVLRELKQLDEFGRI